MAGSFVVNVADAVAFEHPLTGVTIDFDVRGIDFRDTAINLRLRAGARREGQPWDWPRGQERKVAPPSPPF